MHHRPVMAQFEGGMPVIFAKSICQRSKITQAATPIRKIVTMLSLSDPMLDDGELYIIFHFRWGVLDRANSSGMNELDGRLIIVLEQ